MILTKNRIQNFYLVILGDGEEKTKLFETINNLGIADKVLLLGFQKNIYPYLKNSKCFVLSSLWEDPGFVLIEAAFLNSAIISSDCPNGPEELIEKDNGGFLFKNNDSDSFQIKFTVFSPNFKIFFRVEFSSN